VKYAKWAAALSPKICQITFFGMEESTDWGMRRRGAFRDHASVGYGLLKFSEEASILNIVFKYIRQYMGIYAGNLS
jgi:hypothetical protein